MRITSIGPSYINQPKVNNNISFGSVQRDVYCPDTVTVKYRNNTCLLRGDLNWKMIARHIESKKVPQMIYCYACSDGSEPYSIALSLIDKLGYDEAQKHFPIIAKDIDSSMINRAKMGVISLGESDLDRFSLLKNLKFEDYFQKIGLKDYENKTNCEVNDFYQVSEKLRKCVCFEEGDMVSDSARIRYSDSMIFFRNALPYVAGDSQKVLMGNFREHFEPTTSFVVGSFDKESFWDKTGDTHAFDDLLFENRLWQVKPMVYERYNLTENPFNPINWGKILSNSAKMFVLETMEMFRPAIY